MDFIIFENNYFRVFDWQNIQIQKHSICANTPHVFFCRGYGVNVGLAFLNKYPQMVKLMMFTTDAIIPHSIPQNKIHIIKNNKISHYGAYKEAQRIYYKQGGGKRDLRGNYGDRNLKGNYVDGNLKGNYVDGNLKQNYIDGYTLVKKLGTGISGSAYLAIDKKTGQKYAMKIEHVPESKTEGDDSKFHLQAQRELDFSDTLNTKYPNQFMKIYKYENKKCAYHHMYEPKKFKRLVHNKEKFEQLKKFHSSPYCSIKICSLVGETYRKSIYKITDKKRLLCDFIQIVNIAYLINKNGYLHQDLHPGNIGLLETSDKYLNIMGKNIPTYGYIFQAIDYGMILHSKYNLNEKEKLILAYDTDLRKNIHSVIQMCMLKNYFELRETPLDKMEIPSDILEEIEPHLKVAVDIDNKHWSNANRKFLTPILYTILHFDDFQKRCGEVSGVKLFDFISVDTVKYIMANYYNLGKILEHLIALGGFSP